jgi:hypothetical protein
LVQLLALGTFTFSVSSLHFYIFWLNIWKIHNKILIVYVYILFFLLVYINVYDVPLLLRIVCRVSLLEHC